MFKELEKNILTVSGRTRELLTEAQREVQMYEERAKLTQMRVNTLEYLYTYGGEKYGEELEKAYDDHEIVLDDLHRAQYTVTNLTTILNSMRTAYAAYTEL